MMNIGNAEVMNSKQIKEILRALKEQWGCGERFPYGLLKKDDDIFLVTRAADELDLSQLNINSAGLYFGEFRHGQMRLSIEGSQLVGPKAKKNIVTIENTDLWIRGHNLKAPKDAAGFAIIKHGSDFFGCGRIKNGQLLNFIPKSRRLLSEV